MWKDWEGMLIEPENLQSAAANLEWVAAVLSAGYVKKNEGNCGNFKQKHPV